MSGCWCLRIVASFVMGAAALGVSPEITAQCTKDTDCKGDRICVDGSCAASTPQGPPISVSAAAPAPRDARPASTGWSLGAGVFGFVSIPAVVVAAVMADAASEESDANNGKNVVLNLPATIVETAYAGVSIPLVFAGGRSARHGGGVRGVRGLRVTGWVFYGLTMAADITFMSLSAADVNLPKWEGTAVSGGFGVVALTMFSSDALVCHGQAKRAAQAQGSTATRERDRPFELSSIFLTPVARDDGATAFVGGIAGRF